MFFFNGHREGSVFKPSGKKQNLVPMKRFCYRCGIYVHGRMVTNLAVTECDVLLGVGARWRRRWSTALGRCSNR